MGDTWSLGVVSQLLDGPSRFTELLRALGISHRMLTQTLRGLERDGLVFDDTSARRPHAPRRA